jgi:predicted enzyme related to lactoylglutathione lyase
MNRPVHFEIQAEDTERASAFSSAVFGWRTAEWEGPADYWLITTGPDDQPGINGGILRRQGPDPAPDAPVIAFVCTIEVPALDDTVAAATASGGTVAMPRMPVLGVGWLAYCKDTEGNIFGALEPDATAG